MTEDLRVWVVVFRSSECTLLRSSRVNLEYFMHRTERGLLSSDDANLLLSAARLSQLMTASAFCVHMRPRQSDHREIELQFLQFDFPEFSRLLDFRGNATMEPSSIAVMPLYRLHDSVHDINVCFEFNLCFN